MINTPKELSDQPVSRLAPSPTGALHLGNARTFLINWAIARQNGWRLLMRMEDLDGPRIKDDAAQQAIDILQWLGLEWDGPVLWQSHDLTPYEAAMRELARQKRVYSCRLSRKEIEAAATAPHAGDSELRYPRKLRPAPDDLPDRYQFDQPAMNYRLTVPDRTLQITDRIHGSVQLCPAEEVGDFVVWTKRGLPSYQLAVVVDDHRQTVTDVIRGDDLLPSAGRQELLYDALGMHPPNWWHLPLVTGIDGRRLAKRHGDTRISSYREAGVPPERIIGLLAAWSGVCDQRQEMSAEAFRTGFALDRMPRTPIVFTAKDDAWLNGAC